MMDFFAEGKKDDDKFKGLAKEIKLVDICQPSYRFMYQNWQPQEKKRAKWNCGKSITSQKTTWLKSRISAFLEEYFLVSTRKETRWLLTVDWDQFIWKIPTPATYKAMMENGYEFFQFNYLPGDEIVPAEYTRKFEIFTGSAIY